MRPFQERKTRWRGVLDLLGGCYPAFVFGGKLSERILPVFHFHEVSVSTLEPYLHYLNKNGYRTVRSDAVARWVRNGEPPGEKCVMLCFDDAWASMWTVAAPLLKRYGMQAVTYAIPGRIQDADSVRPTRKNGQEEAGLEDRSDVPFSTWPELRAMAESGVVDVQSHTYSHAMIAVEGPYEASTSSSPAVDGNTVQRLSRPLKSAGSAPIFAGPEESTWLQLPTRSRCSDALRCLDPFGESRWETEEERNEAIRFELAESKSVLEQNLPGHRIHQVCFPWAVCGDAAERIARESGYESAVADRLFGKRAAVRNGNPYRIMRLKHRWIYALPGAGRRTCLNRGKKEH